MQALLRRSPLARSLFQWTLVFSFLILGAATSWAIVVTSIADSGPGSLRQAILDARDDPSANVISFDPAVFPPPPALPGVILLTLASGSLPSLTGLGDSIDGTGSGIIVDGSALDPVDEDNGLRVRARDISIRGITVQNFAGDGIRIQPNPNLPGGQSGQVVTGIEISGNNITNNNQGIRVLSGNDNNEVEVRITGNTVSNYSSGGIRVDGSNSGGAGGNNVTATISANVIRGATPPNNPSNSLAGDGINVSAGSGTNTGDNVIQATISDNVIQNNFGEGLRVVGAGTGSSSSNNIVDATITGNNIRGNGVGSGGSGTGITVAGGPTVSVPATTSGNIVTFVVDGNLSNNNRDNGIGVIGNNGSNHVVSGTISNNNFNGNLLSGIELRGQGSSTTVRDIDIQFNTVTNNGQRGLLLFGGNSAVTVNATISNVLVNGNRFDGNGLNGILASLGTGTGNVISFAGITNNSMSRNIGGDGLFIPTGVNGTGATPIAGNRADANGVDGIDLNSTGYFVSNNTASRNGGDGISLGGNADGGGNTARNNGGCNIC